MPTLSVTTSHFRESMTSWARGKGKIFGKLDMTKSFFQTRVHPDDIHLTAVRTPWGLYEWTVMPMGCCNAPSTHQRRMIDALRPLLGRICYVYLDDIIIWSVSIEEHERNVKAVLEALRADKLYCNETKSQLFATEVSFLGHVIGQQGIKPDPQKTERSSIGRFQPQQPTCEVSWA